MDRHLSNMRCWSRSSPSHAPEAFRYLAPESRTSSATYKASIRDISGPLRLEELNCGLAEGLGHPSLPAEERVPAADYHLVQRKASRDRGVLQEQGTDPAGQ